MALPDVPTAAEMAYFLRYSEPQHDFLRFREDMYEAMEGWTARERREVAEAAKDDITITAVAIDVARMTTKSATIVGSIVEQLTQVQQVEIADTGNDGEPAPRSVVDKVLMSVAKCPSTVDRFKLGVPSSPRAFLRIVERFPDLEEFTYEDRFYDESDEEVTDRVPFLMAVATSVSHSLASLNHVGLRFEMNHPAISGLLSALHASKAPLETVEFGFFGSDADWDAVLLQVAFHCACTRTTKTAIFHGYDSMVNWMVDVAPLFGVGHAPHPFSTSITEMQFRFCTLEEEAPRRGRLAARAIKALQNVETLRFDMCACPFALKIVAKLPRLKTLTYLCRPGTGETEHLGPDEAQDAYDDRFTFLRTNQDVSAFCRILSRNGSLLEDVEIDLQGSEHESFPALARLLHVSRGRLVLHLGCLPRASRPHLVSGAESLGPHLRELHLRFRYSRLEDQDYADILHPLQSNDTVRFLGFQWEHVDGGPSDRTWEAMRVLVESNRSIETLSFRGLDPEPAAEMLEFILPALRSTNRSIHTLDVRWTDLAEVWPRLLGPVLEMLQENYVVSNLMEQSLTDLLGYGIHDDPVVFLVKQNRYGRRLLMGRGGGGGGNEDDDDSNNSHDGKSGSGPSTSFFCPLGLWATVLARISDDDEEQVMYKFLRSKPDLLLAGLTPARRPVRGRPNRGRKRGWGSS